MTKNAYQTGFEDYCRSKGLNSFTTSSLYKEAQLAGLAQIFRGVRQIARPMGDIGLGAAKVTGDILSIPAKAISTFGRYTMPSISKGLSRMFESRWLRHTPGLRSFGRGFSKAQRKFERNPGFLSTILAGTGFGPGGIFGNTLAGLGSFAAAHPYLGTAAIGTPIAYLAAKRGNGDDSQSIIDTMTPVQKRIFERQFRPDGYSGLHYDYDDLSALGTL